MTPIKYNNLLESKAFFDALKIKINAHFVDSATTQYATRWMWVKIVMILLLWLGTYLCIISNTFNSYFLFAFIIIHGLTHLLIPFNISHDANHAALSKNKKINTFFSHSLALIGVSQFFWRISHNKEHHSFINVSEIDTNVNGYGILKFSPHDVGKKQFRFQHIYATLVYSLTTLNYLFMKEIKMIKSKEYKIPVAAYLELIIVKVFYFAYVLVLPYFLLDVSFLTIFTSFVLVHFMLGIILSLVFQCGHFTEDAHYPTIEDGIIQDGWAIHTLKTTCDYAAKNNVFTHLVGGINIHIPHHLFPTICHIHYKSLVPIIKSTALEYGLPYREYRTFSGALFSHLKLLKTLGAH